jgi:hypothetical protein
MNYADVAKGALIQIKGAPVLPRPAAQDIDVQPLAENRVAEADQNGGRLHPQAEERPSGKSRASGRKRQCRAGNQRIAGGAVQQSLEDLVIGPVLP